MNKVVTLETAKPPQVQLSFYRVEYSFEGKRQSFGIVARNRREALMHISAIKNSNLTLAREQ